MTSHDDELFHQVGLLLGPRHGWSLELSTTPGAPPSWCFESHGEVELSIRVDGGTISIFVPSQDQDIALEGVDELATWIDSNEARFLRR